MAIVKYAFLCSCANMLDSKFQPKLRHKKIADEEIDSVTNDEALQYFGWFVQTPDFQTITTAEALKFLAEHNQEPYEFAKGEWRKELKNLVEQNHYMGFFDDVVEPAQPFYWF